MTKILTINSGKQNPFAKKNQKDSLHPERTSERGAAMLVALIVIAAFIFLAASASKTVTAISLEAERVEQIRQEKARAEYYMSMAEATLKYDVRQTYNDFQMRGKQRELQLRGDGNLPMFDPLTEPSSRPLLTLEGEHTGESPSTATSLYGAVSPWSSIAIVASREYISTKTKEKDITAPDAVEILSFKEVYRRIMPGVSEPIYAFRYTVRAHAGEFGEVVREDTIHLGPAITEDSPTVVNCSDLTLAGVANPANVAWGSNTSLELTYSNTERVNIYNSLGATIFNQNVANESAPRTIAYTTAPLNGPTSFVGEAVRGGCQVQVPIIVGVTFNQNISYTVNGVQTVNIIEGENVRYDWNVTNAAAGYTTSYITYGSDTTQYHANVFSNSITVPGPTVSTTSTLHARDTRYNGNAEQTATVNINVCRLPRITNFTVTPNSVTQGGNQTVRFDWQTQFASGIRIVRENDGQVLYSVADSSGSWSMPQPQSATQYRLEAVSDCGAPPATATIPINVNPTTCTPPAINNFAVNPATVIYGENRNIVFTWNISGTADTLTIDQGIGAVTGSSVTIPQPQVTTTYTLTVSGCSQSRQMQVTVNVEPPTTFCPNVPGPGQPDAVFGGAMAGRQNIPGCQCGDAEFRIFYRISHYPNGTFRFNAQFYYSFADPRPSGAIVIPGIQTSYPFEFGRLKIKLDYFGARFYDGLTNTQIAYKPYETQLYGPSALDPGIGFVTVGLVGDGIDNPGFEVPALPFDFTNDVLRANSFVTQAYTYRHNTSSYPPASLNVSVSGGSPGRWRCPS